MKCLKRTLTFVLAMVCVCMCSVTAFATELTDNQCNLTICIIDYMGGSFQEDITVHFKSESTGHDFTTVVTQSEYLINGSVAASVPMGDTYDISFSFKSDSKNLVAIREGDGTEIKSFTPDSTEHTFEWGLVSTQDLQSTSTNTEGTKSLTTIDTGNEEADEMSVAEWLVGASDSFLDYCKGRKIDLATA